MTLLLKLSLLGLFLFSIESESSSLSNQVSSQRSGAHLPGAIVIQYKDSGDFQEFSCNDVKNNGLCKGLAGENLVSPGSELGYMDSMEETICFCLKNSGECLVFDPTSEKPWKKFAKLPFDDDSEKIEAAIYFLDEAVFSTNKNHLYELLPSGKVKKHNVRWHSPLICGAGDGERDYGIVKNSSSILEIWYINNQRKWETHYLPMKEVFGTAGCVAHGDKIYMAGGASADGSPSDSVFAIDTKTWKVEKLNGTGRLPQPSDHVKMAIINDKPAAFGVNSKDGKVKQVYTYDKSSNSWTLSPLALKNNEEIHNLFQM